MVHVIFDPSTPSIDDFISNQVGAGEFKYFKTATPYQRGYGRLHRGAGIGDVFRVLWRHIMPMVKTIGTSAGRKLVDTTTRILDKVESGDSSKPEVIKEIKKSVDNLLEKSGVGRQLGTGIKGNRKRRSTNIIGKTIKKKFVWG